MPEELKSDIESKDQQTESSKNASKKPRKNRGLQKRTKTGCMTCRHRRVKCDESKPICKNCVKSRRTCLWLPQPEHQSHDPNTGLPSLQYPPNFRTQPNFTHLNPYLPPMQHVNFAAFASVAALEADLQHNTCPLPNPYYDHSPDYELSSYPLTGTHGQAGPWLPDQHNWMHPQLVGPQPSYQTGLNPEIYATAYTAYSVIT